MVNIIVAPMKKLVLMRDVVALFSEMTRSCSDSDFSENTTITVLPGYLYVISGKYIKIIRITKIFLCCSSCLLTNLTVLQRGAEPGLYIDENCRDPVQSNSKAQNFDRSNHLVLKQWDKKLGLLKIT